MGGLETHVATFTNELLRRGHHVMIHSMRTNPAFLEQIHDPFERFHHVTGTDDPVRDLKHFRPDIIHAHPFYAIGRGYKISKALKRSLVVNIHGLYDSGLDRSPAGLEISNGISRIIAVDMGVAALLLKHIPHPEKISVIRNGIDLTAFNPLPYNSADRIPLGMIPEWYTLTAVSRFADGKEQPIIKLINMAPSLADQLGGLNLILVGDGHCFAQVQESCNTALNGRHNLRIALVGGQTDVRPYLALTDLVVACGRAALEALACQRPVFVAYQTGFAGIFGRDNFENLFNLRGYYHTLTESEAFEQLLALAWDKGRRDQLAAEGLEIIRQHYDIVTVVDQLERIYKQYI